MIYYYYKIKDRFLQGRATVNPISTNTKLSEFPVESSSVPTTQEIELAYKNFLASKEKNMSIERLANVRARRNSILAASDWTQASDSPLSQQLKDKWKQYRQELRDLPDSGKPYWPTPPPTK